MTDENIIPNRRNILKWGTTAIAASSVGAEWVRGARSAGKNPADMPVLVEQYAVVGD